MHKLLKDLTQLKPMFPVVTIIAPLARAMPERAHNSARVHALIDDAVKILEKEAHASAKSVKKQLEELREQEDFSHETADGVAYVVAADYSERIPLVGECEQLVYVGHYPALSAIGGYMHDTIKYNTVLLSEEKARLFVTTYAAAEEVITPLQDAQGRPLQGFPLTALRPEDRVVQAVGIGDRDARYRDAEIETFIRLVASELHKYVNKEKLPVVLCGSAHLIELLDEALRGKVPVIARVVGNYINEAPDVIGKLAWHMVLQHRAEEHAHALRAFQEAAGHNKQACGLLRTWETIKAGRVQKLFVERGAAVSGRIDPTNAEQIQVMPPTPEIPVDNLIDIFVRETLLHGGDVIVVSRGSLESCEGIGALLRY